MTLKQPAHALQREVLKALNIHFEEVDARLVGQQLIEHHRLHRHIRIAAADRFVGAVHAVVASASIEFQLDLLRTDSGLMHIDVLAVVIGEVAVQQSGVVGIRLKRDHTAMLADERREEQGVVADVGPDIDHRLPWADQPFHEPDFTRLKRLTEQLE